MRMAIFGLILIKSKRMDKNKFIPGDIVKCDNEICKVLEIGTSELYDGDYTCKLRYPSHNIFTALQNELDGVALTTEILDKNGWEHLHDVYFKDYPQRKLVVSDGEACIINESCSLFLCKAEYVHQLQHLLFGLGINHEMEV